MISAISVIGMAVGTAALILILSVYNGFDKIIKDNLSDFDPDVLICASEGKFFTPSDTLLACLSGDPRIRHYGCVLQDNVFLSYDERQQIAKAKGIDFRLEKRTTLCEHIIDGNFKLHQGDVPMACVGSGLAASMGIRPHFLTPLYIYYPDKDSRISASNPASSLHSAKIFPSSLFSVNASIDAETIVVPEETMRGLMGLAPDENGNYPVTGIEIQLVDSQRNLKSFCNDASQTLGPSFKVLDRYAQHPSLFRMMRIEKAAVFLILFFMVILISFNIFGSLSMLIIEKEEDIATLHALGAGPGMTRRIFILEGWMISLAGLATGLVFGLALAFVQQRFGIVKMPGNFLITSYPVVIKAADVLLTTTGVAAIGLLIALGAGVRNCKAS